MKKGWPLPRLEFVLGWRNLWRNSRRTLLAISAIAIGQFSLVWIDSFFNGYEALIKERMTGPTMGDLQIHHPTYRQDVAIEKVIPDWKKAEAELRTLSHLSNFLPRVYAPVLLSLKEEGHIGMVMGLNFAQENGRSGLLEGMPADRFPGANEVVLGKGLAKDMGVKVGDKIAVMGQAADGSIANDLFLVKGIATLASDQANQNGLLLNLANAQEFLGLPNQVHEIILHSDQAISIEALQSVVKNREYFKNLDVLTWKELSPQLAELLNVFQMSNFIVLILVFITTISGVANTLLMSTYERMHEIGMLLALGCKPQRLNRILIIESVFQGTLGGLVGSFAAVYLLSYQSRNGIDLSFLVSNEPKSISISFEGMKLNMFIFPKLQVSDLMQGFGAILFTSILACWLPGRKIGRMEPMEAMRS